MTCTPENAHRQQTADIAWKTIRLANHTINLLWELFEEEFRDKLGAEKQPEEHELPF